MSVMTCMIYTIYKYIYIIPIYMYNTVTNHTPPQCAAHATVLHTPMNAPPPTPNTPAHCLHQWKRSEGPGKSLKSQLYMYIYIHMYMYICIGIHIYICIYIYILYRYTCTHMYMYICTYTYIYSYV